MNTTSRTRIAALALLAGTALVPAARAETFITDGSNIAWYGYRSNTAPSFSYESGTTTITNLDSESYVWGYLPTGVVLSVGDSLTLSGTATFKSVGASSTFYFGLYNSGENAAPTAGTTFSSIVSGTYDMTGFFAGTKQTKESCTAAVYSRFAGKAPSAEGSGGAGFMTTNQGKSYIASETLSDSSLTHPTADVAYDFSLTILRTQTGYKISLGDQTSVSFDAAKSLSSNTFDVVGMKSPGSGITLSDFSVSKKGTVIPEPSAFGLMFGVLSLLVAAFPRRRSRKG